MDNGSKLLHQNQSDKKVEEVNHNLLTVDKLLLHYWVVNVRSVGI